MAQGAQLLRQRVGQARQGLALMGRLLLQPTAQCLLNRTQLQAKAVDLLVLDTGDLAALLKHRLLRLSHIGALALGIALQFVAQLSLQVLLQRLKPGDQLIGRGRRVGLGQSLDEARHLNHQDQADAHQRSQ